MAVKTLSTEDLCDLLSDKVDSFSLGQLKGSWLAKNTVVVLDLIIFTENGIDGETLLLLLMILTSSVQLFPRQYLGSK